MRTVKFHNGIPMISKRGRKQRNISHVSTCKLPTKVNQMKKVKSKILPLNSDVENTLVSKMPSSTGKEKKTAKIVNRKPNKNDADIKNSPTKNEAAIKNSKTKNNAAIKSSPIKNEAPIKNSLTKNDATIKNSTTKNETAIKNSPTKNAGGSKNSSAKKEAAIKNSLSVKNDATIKNSSVKKEALIKNLSSVKNDATIKKSSAKKEATTKNSSNKNNAAVIKNPVNNNLGKEHTDELNDELNIQEETVKDPFSNHRHGITVIVKGNNSTEVQALSPETKKIAEKSASKNSSDNDDRPKNLVKSGNQEKLNKIKSLCVRIDNPDNVNKETSDQLIKKPKNVLTDLVQKKTSLTGMQCCEPKKEKKIIICTKTNYQKLHQKQHISKIKKKIRRMNFQALCMVEEINKKLMEDNKKITRNKLENLNEEIRKMNSKNSPTKARPPLPFHCALREKIIRIDNEIRRLQKESHPKCRKFNAISKTHLQSYAF